MIISQSLDCNFNEKLKGKIILSAFKQWFTSSLKKLHLDNGEEFRNKEMENY